MDGNILRQMHDRMLRWNNVGPDFFTTLDIRMIDGRDFNEADSQNSAPVAVVNQTFVEHFFEGRNPIGHTVSFTRRKQFTIIGVAVDSKYQGINEKPIAMAWFPYTQVGSVGAMHFELRVAGQPASILPRVRQTVAGFAPDLALLQPKTQQAEFDETISSQRLLARLSLAFAVLAIALVATGLYGTTSYHVTRRTSELGIRMALGAERGRLLWMVLRESLALSVAGIALGVPAVLASSRLLTSLLYGLAPTDVPSIAMAVMGILAIGVLGAFVPARRAASVDPIVALRYE